MALIKCPECGATVSDRAPNCVHCGFPFAAKNSADENIALSEQGSTPEEIVIERKPIGPIITEEQTVTHNSDITAQSDEQTLANSPDLYNSPVSSENITQSSDTGNKKKKIVFPIVLLCLALVVAAGVFVYFKVIIPKQQIESLQALIESNKWEEAINYIKTTDNSKCAEHLSECYYNLALEQMETENWQKALENLELSDVASAKKLMEECKNHIYADYEYQQVFESCIKYRYSDESDDDTGAELSKNELDKLESFKKKEFNSKELKELADEYYAALTKQYNYYIDEDGAYDDDDWEDAYQRRLAVIYELISNYGFFSDNKEIADSYTEYYFERPKCYEAEKVFSEQLFGGHIEDYVTETGKTWYVTLINETDSNIAVNFTLFYYYNDIEADSFEYDYSRVKPNGTCKIDFPEIDSKKGDWSYWVYIDVYDIVD